MVTPAGIDRTPVIGATCDVGFPYNSDPGRPQNEAQTLFGRTDHRDPEKNVVGASVPDLARRHGVAENTIYRWKSKLGGMEINEARRLRELEQENARLKRLFPEAELAKTTLKELAKGKW